MGRRAVAEILVGLVAEVIEAAAGAQLVDRDEGLALTEDVALDLGDVVTITVEPGDRLNDVPHIESDGLPRPSEWAGQ